MENINDVHVDLVAQKSKTFSNALAISGHLHSMPQLTQHFSKYYFSERVKDINLNF